MDVCEGHILLACLGGKNTLHHLMGSVQMGCNPNHAEHLRAFLFNQHNTTPGNRGNTNQHIWRNVFPLDSRPWPHWPWHCLLTPISWYDWPIVGKQRGKPTATNHPPIPTITGCHHLSGGLGWLEQTGWRWSLGWLGYRNTQRGWLGRSLLGSVADCFPWWDQAMNAECLHLIFLNHLNNMCLEPCWFDHDKLNHWPFGVTVRITHSTAVKTGLGHQLPEPKSCSPQRDKRNWKFYSSLILVHVVLLLAPTCLWAGQPRLNQVLVTAQTCMAMNPSESEYIWQNRD